MSAQEATAAAAAGQQAVDGLVDHIRRTCDQRCEAILHEASAEADHIVQRARRKARRRVHEAAEEARADSRRRLRSARAQAETRLRQARHAATHEALEMAWGQLQEALRQRWQDEEARRTWVRAALAQAARKLPPGTWHLEHPTGWSPSEVADLIDEAGSQRPGADIETAADDNVQAGLRLSCGGATLDASLAGLLVRPTYVQALLLSELEASGATEAVAEQELPEAFEAATEGGKRRDAAS